MVAFGFFYVFSGPEEWELHVNDQVVTLTPYELNNYQPNFIGIIDIPNQISSFVLTSPSYAQGGLSIDDLSFVSQGMMMIKMKKK